jgi:basic membrane protein A and related proteins
VVDPSIEIRSTSLTEQGFSGFNSETLAFQAAERMYRRGADVIYHAAGASGFGLFEAALQLSDDLGRHLWGIGVDTDQYRELSASDPWRPHVLASMVKRYDQAVYALLAAYARGTFAPGSRELESGRPRRGHLLQRGIYRRHPAAHRGIPPADHRR